MIEVTFSEKDLQEISYLRYHHPSPKIQKRMEVLWLKSLNVSRKLTAQIAQVHPDSVTNYVRKYSEEGLESLLKLNYKHPESQLQSHSLTIKEYFTQHLPRTVREAGRKIKELTQIERKPTQIRQFLKRIGFSYFRSKWIPAIADPQEQQAFKERTLEPLIEKAKKGECQLFFVDAAHFVYSVILGYVWALVQQVVPSFPGRSRFNVLGALNAITHELFTICNETYINSHSLCALMTRLRQTYVEDPITLVLDNARYQKCKLVTEFASMANIQLVYLPPYSPNLNLIERVWKFIRKEALSNAIHENFSSFKKAISDCCNNLNTTHQQAMKSLLTLKFQTFEKTEKSPA